MFLSAWMGPRLRDRCLSAIYILKHGRRKFCAINLHDGFQQKTKPAVIIIKVCLFFIIYFFLFFIKLFECAVLFFINYQAVHN